MLMARSEAAFLVVDMQARLVPAVLEDLKVLKPASSVVRQKPVSDRPQ